MRNSVFASFVIGGTLLHTTAAGQRSSCEACFSLSPVVTLSSSVGPIVPSSAQSIVRTTDGRWLVSHLMAGPAQFLEYDPAGRFLGVLGKTGSGPGELASPPILYSGPGRTIWAIDRRQVIRFDERLNHIASKPLASASPAVGAVMLRAGLVMRGRLRDADGHTYALLLYDTAGTLVKKLERQSDEVFVSSAIGPALKGGFWVLRLNDVVLRRYSDEGELQETFRLHIDHFQPWRGKASQRGLEGFDFPPRPAHIAVVDLGSNRLAVLTRVASRDWKPSGGVIRPDDADLDRQFDTQVALLDLRTGRTLATRTFPQALLGIQGTSDYFYTTASDQFGDILTTVFQLHVRER